MGTEIIKIAAQMPFLVDILIYEVSLCVFRYRCSFTYDGVRTW